MTKKTSKKNEQEANYKPKPALLSYTLWLQSTGLACLIHHACTRDAKIAMVSFSRIAPPVFCFVRTLRDGCILKCKSVKNICSYRASLQILLENCTVYSQETGKQSIAHYWSAGKVYFYNFWLGIFMLHPHFWRQSRYFLDSNLRFPNTGAQQHLAADCCRQAPSIENQTHSHCFVIIPVSSDHLHVALWSRNTKVNFLMIGRESLR